MTRLPWRGRSWRRLPRRRLFGHRLGLQTRFTLVAAGAVAATALAITAVAFLAVRTDLENQIRQQITDRAANVKHAADHLHGPIPDGWVPPHSNRYGANTSYTQVITASGGVWVAGGSTGLLSPDAADLAVARGDGAAFFADRKVGGRRSAVLTTQLAPGLALQVAQSLRTTDLEVASVGATLAVVSAIGIMAATAVGWAVARAGLAPVARLAGVAEEVTATADPSRRVRVDRQDELGRLAASFNSMLGALQRSLGAQRRLVSDASHELRTPLASLRVNVELLADDPGMPPAERQEVLTRVVAQVAELSRLVAGVTELARNETPATGWGAWGPVRLDEAAATAVDAARRDWPKTEFTADLESCVVEGSADRLRVAIRNLLDNAAKFGPPEGPVHVRLAGGSLTVLDHGPGISPDDAPHVFDRFYRSLSARAVPGSGLGLTVVREIARGHSGTATAENGPDGGTLMRLTLPAMPGRADSPELPSAFAAIPSARSRRHAQESRHAPVDRGQIPLSGIKPENCRMDKMYVADKS